MCRRVAPRNCGVLAEARASQIASKKRSAGQGMCRFNFPLCRQSLMLPPISPVRQPPSLQRRHTLNHEETPGVSETGAGLDGAQGVLRRLIRCTAHGAWRHGRVVGQRYPCARDHLGGGSSEVFAADPQRRQTAAIYPVWRHRCLQCTDGGTETTDGAHRSPEATGGSAPSAPRLPAQRARRALYPGNALPPSSAARYLQPLPSACQGDTSVAGAASGITGCSEGGETRVQLVADPMDKPLIIPITVNTGNC